MAMASASDIDILTRVGPGTPMGALMREYWVPAAMSSEVTVDGPPLRLMLLGEKLIAFRDSSGRVGIFDHRCPHRCASLFFGRNEHDGLRCVYHGWKFDVAGNCVEQPNVPPQQAFPDKVKAKAYRVTERNGLIWAYMGTRAEAPPLPLLEAALLPQPEIMFVQRECNWLQAMEGDIDTSHFGFLHAGHVDPASLPEDSPIRYTVMNRTPEYHVGETEWGTQYAAYRPADHGRTHWRFANFLFPFWTQQPQGDFGDHIHARAWVPMDDTHLMFIFLSMKPLPPRQFEYLPNGSGWLDRFLPEPNAGNDYNIDREAQREMRLYAGIADIHLQDQMVTESMGPVVDHSMEHLAASDLMITRTRQRLIAALRAHRDEGILPPGIADPEIYRRARSGQFLTEKGVGWSEAYASELRGAQRVGIARAAE
jgi:phthalate 4,5-dioxygenase oxygenase subunit